MQTKAISKGEGSASLHKISEISPRLVSRPPNAPWRFSEVVMEEVVYSTRGIP